MPRHLTGVERDWVSVANFGKIDIPQVNTLSAQASAMQLGTGRAGVFDRGEDLDKRDVARRAGVRISLLI